MFLLYNGKIIIDAEQFQRTISRISHQIIEKHASLDNLVLVGIKRRGAEIAEMLQKGYRNSRKQNYR
ncbi:bifunctional pyrimidine regulatory protein PyrR/uracil phosphoribosyltransferase [Actinobacillus equuli]|nr:bifunctional pyrimidine regulatory protein PyrR/uracil phosphoribosyltransferase [Actinobacillus equuli]